MRLLLAADRTIVDCQVGFANIRNIGSKVAWQDKYGNTALHYACEEERNEVARLLISHGANREVGCCSKHFIPCFPKGVDFYRPTGGKSRGEDSP